MFLEDKKQDITKQVAENYKTVAEFERVKSRLEVERDNYKDSLETAQTALKKFEGVNVEELKGEIEKLNGDLAAKETEYQRLIASLDLIGSLPICASSRLNFSISVRVDDILFFNANTLDDKFFAPLSKPLCCSFPCSKEISQASLSP